MAYSTVTDFKEVYSIEKLVHLTRGDEEGTPPAQLDADGINIVRLNSAITKADALIDSYLKNRIDDLPLVSPPPYIKDYSISITVKSLHRGIQYKDIPEFIRKEYEDALKHLKDIAGGKSNLILPEGDTSTKNTLTKYDENAPSIFTSGAY